MGKIWQTHRALISLHLSGVRRLFIEPLWTARRNTSTGHSGITAVVETLMMTTATFMLFAGI